MGNSNNRFTQLEAVDVKSDIYKLYNAKRIEGNKPVTVFQFELEGKIEVKKIQHHINTVKQLRHPSILKYVDSSEDGKSIYLGTEPITPLKNCIETMSPSEIILGLCEISTAIDWIHSMKNDHKAISMDSIYVSNDKNYSDSGESKSDSTPITSDDTQFFRIVTEVCKNKKFENFDVSELLQCKSLEKFMISTIWKSDSFCRIMLFLNDLQLKSFKEKDDFFIGLSSEVKRIPTDLVIKRLLKRFLTIPFFSEPSSMNFMPFLLSVKKDGNFGGLLTEEEYKTLVVPFLKGCLMSRNIALRVRLLQTVEYFGWSLPPSSLLDEVFTSLCDTNDDVCMCSMDALVILAKFILKNDEANLLKIQSQLHRFCVSRSMNLAIRSHALLCLVKLYSLPKSRKGIVISGLEICLYDVSSELKLYALNIIMMNMNQFDPRELISVVMSLMLPLNLDQNSDVRTKSLKVMRNILNHLDETDLSKFTYGNVTSAKPDDYIASLKSEFPSESKQEPVRTHIFQGALLNLIANVQTPTKHDQNENVDVNSTPKKVTTSPIVRRIETEATSVDNSPQIETYTPTKQDVIEGDDWNSEWKEEKPEEKKKPVKNLESDDEVEETDAPNIFDQIGMSKKDKTVKDLLHESTPDINLDKWENNLE